MHLESSQPVINGSQTLYVTVGKQFTTVYTTTNADGSDVTLSMSGLPSGATLSPTSGLFSWLPLTMETVGNLRFLIILYIKTLAIDILRSTVGNLKL